MNTLARFLVKRWRELRQQHRRLRTFFIFTTALLGALIFSKPLTYSSLSFRSLYPHVANYRWSFLDLVRITLQTLWLVFVNFHNRANKKPTVSTTNLPMKLRHTALSTVLNSLRYLANTLFTRMTIIAPHLLGSTVFRIVFTLIAALIVAVTISLPMDASAQAIMLIAFWAVALWVRGSSGRLPVLLMIVLSVLVSSRYLWWRITQTINWDIPLDATFGIILLSAEFYAWTILVLGYIQTAWPLNRQVASLPESTDNWPHVDIFIPSYNEPLSVVRPTILAALAIEWPEEKLSVYVLDDGKRPDFKAFCAEAGAGYIVRPDNSHAKAGNLNHALTKTKGEYVAIFDCDHIPTRSFLQLSIGWFYHDPKLALVQTPHHFFSPDPFEKNLSIFRNKPNENELFYGLIQDGNDLWNSSFFCGSCAVLKRAPLEEIGGIATETVTEDAHTALKMHRLGYTSAYLNIPQAAGLATESLADHIGQRIRWARGMAQIFRLDNPLFGRGLNAGQRLCYLNAMLYFFNGIPRVIFMLAPLAFLILGSYIIFAPAVMIAAFALPHIIHSYLTNSRHQGVHRHSFWAEMYETVLAWYILKPTTVALFAPHLGKFNVTSKGGLNTTEFFDWKISKPYLALVCLSFIGVGFGMWRFLFGPSEEFLSVVLNLLWITYNLIILGGAIAVAEEAKQVRKTHRISVNRTVTMITEEGHAYPVNFVDYAVSSVGIQLPDSLKVSHGQEVYMVLDCRLSPRAFKGKVVSVRGQTVGVHLHFASIQEEQLFICATFGRADAWINWRPTNEDKPLNSFYNVIGISFSGYRRLVKQFAPFLLPFVGIIQMFWQKLKSVLPKKPSILEINNKGSRHV